MVPAYVSHAIMASDVYDRIDNKIINKEYMLTFSLGGDLARFSKCRRLSHRVKQEDFIDNMWQYIKNNNLNNDSRYLGVLYGHICHYYMDLICHPLIRKMDKISNRVRVKSHTLIEGYIDSYLIKNKYNQDVSKFDTRYIFRGSVLKIWKMIDYVYDETYGIKYVSFSYYITKILYSKIRWLFLIFGKELLRRFSYFDEYMDINRELDILNELGKINYKDYLGEDCNDSFMDLYEYSVNLVVERINGLK